MYINLFAIICDNFRLNLFTCTNLNKHVLMYETLQHHNNIWTPQVVSQEINRISEIKILKKYSNRVFPSLFPRFFWLFTILLWGQLFYLKSLKPCAKGCNTVGQQLPTLLRVVAPVTGFKFCATTLNNMQQGVQTDATCNI